jgi:hypothetical protein
MEVTMPAINVVFLCITVLAFIAFALTLFWGETQTRRPSKNAKEGARQPVSSH